MFYLQVCEATPPPSPQGPGRGLSTYGAMEPISAIDVFTRRNPIQQIKKTHMSPAEPPLMRPKVATLHKNFNTKMRTLVKLEAGSMDEPENDFPRLLDDHGKPKN